jgi:isopenicillin N synthase-like dioxygenase
VKPLDNMFVVNLGDMAARWTNDIYKSTLHRVYNKTDSTRYSIPFFCNCNFDSPVKCIVSTAEETKNNNSNDNNGDGDNHDDNVKNNELPTAEVAEVAEVAQNNIAKYEPTTAGVYILERLGLMRLLVENE